MDFLKLVKKKEKKIDVKVIIALVVLIVVTILAKLLSPQADIYASDFLPNDTNFYYHWTNKQAMAIEDMKIFDASLPNDNLAQLSSVLGSSFSDVEEIIWFRTDSLGESDNYLVRFSKISGKYFDSIQNSHQEYYFYQPGKNILLVSDNFAARDDLPEVVVPRFTKNRTDQGVNIYWLVDKEDSPLDILQNWLPDYVLAGDIFVNLQLNSDHLRFNMYSLKSDESVNQENKLTAVRLPDNFDLIMGFQASSTMAGADFIGRNLILPFYDSLPYYNLDQVEIEKYILGDNILIQRGSAWLLVGLDDRQSIAVDLASDFELEEVTKLLPDRTTYVELLAADAQEVLEHEFAGYKYWQIDGLYGIRLENLYYLSNDTALLEDIIVDSRPLRSVFGDCLADSSYQLDDFIRFSVDKLPNNLIKDYLFEHNIDQLEIFSYQNSTVEGMQLCF